MHNSRLKLGPPLQFMTSRDPVSPLILYALVRVQNEMSFFPAAFMFLFFQEDPSLHFYPISHHLTGEEQYILLSSNNLLVSFK